MTSLRLVTGLLCLGAIACRQPPLPVGATATLGDLHIAQAVATNSIGTIGATVLLRVANGGTVPDTLTSVETDVAATSTLHTVAGGGTMAPIAAIPIPAGTTTRLHDGGPHIMIEQLTRTLDPGDSIQVTLHFAHAGTTRLHVPVLQLTAAYESAR